MKAAFRYIAIPEEAHRIAGPHRVIPMDLWAQAHGSRGRTVRITERQWEPEVSRRHARTVLSDLVSAGLLLVAERGDRGSVYRVVDASTGLFGEGVYHNADHNADHNCPEPTKEPDTNADRIADHARVDPRARPTIPYLTLPSDQGELRVETSSTEETVVPLAHPPAAPPALGPADPATEPDWDALFKTVPLTYDDEATDGEASGETALGENRTSWPSGSMGTEAVEACDPESHAAGDAATVAVADYAVGDAGGMAPEVLTPDGCLPLGSATQPPPATRKRKARPAPVGDVETLWEAWRAHGTVRGEPNDHRRRAMERVLRDYPLADVLEMLDAAHTGSTDNWRWLQGATSRSDAKYLKPENLLRPSTIAGRMEDAAEWVEAGRPRHQVEETRAEARAEAAARSLATRATMAWDKTVVPHIGSRMDRLEAVMAAWGDSPRAEEARRAVLGGLREAQGLSAIGMATQFTRPALKRAFVRGFAAALGGTVSEAELLAVG
jgi:hypothetical protein